MSDYDDAVAAKAAAYTAYLNALNAQSYSIEGRSKSNQSIQSLWDQYINWCDRVNELGGTTQIGFTEIGVKSG